MRYQPQSQSLQSKANAAVHSLMVLFQFTTCNCTTVWMFLQSPPHSVWDLLCPEHVLCFRAKFPGNIKKWFGTPQQTLSVLAFIIYQVRFSVLWLIDNPSSFNNNMKSLKEKIILESSWGSLIHIWFILGQLGLLDVLISFYIIVIIFIARKIPYTVVLFWWLIISKLICMTLSVLFINFGA